MQRGGDCNESALVRRLMRITRLLARRLTTLIIADAYTLKILGPRVDEKTIPQIRRNRIINFSGNGGDKIDVDFLQKPERRTEGEPTWTD